MEQKGKGKDKHVTPGTTTTTALYHLRVAGSPFVPVPAETLLINELKADWRNSRTRREDIDVKVIIMMWGKTSRGDERRRDEGRRHRKERDRSSRRREDKGDAKEEDADDRFKLARFGSRVVNLENYMKSREFNFLHYYAGKNDPVGAAIKRAAQAEGMKVTVTSSEKEAGVDLLRDEPFTQHVQEAKRGLYDGFHSGFPCTTFSGLRWRPSPGYPGPCRSKQHPYGLPDNDGHQQRECDVGTLHAARSVYMGKIILEASEDERVKPSVTLENPPPSDVEGHISAWELAEVEDATKAFDFKTAEFPTCLYQKELEQIDRIYKPQMFKGTLQGLGSLSGACECGRGAKHEPVVGKDKSAKAGEYPKTLCDRYAELLIAHFKRMAKMEFLTKREEAMKSELKRLRESNRDSGQAGDSRTSPRRTRRKRDVPVKEEQKGTERRRQPR